MEKFFKLVAFLLIEILGIYCIAQAASIDDLEYQKFTTDSDGNPAIRIVLPDGGGTGGESLWEYQDSNTIQPLTVSDDISVTTVRTTSVQVDGTIVANQVYSGYVKALTLDAYGDYLIIDDGVSIGDDTTVTGSIATSGGPLKISSNLSPSYVINGNFGIGTTSPTAQFEVTGSAKFGSVEITAGSLNISELTPIGNTIVFHGDTYIMGDATITGTTYVDTLEMSSSDMELGGELSADSVLAADLTINKLVSPTGTVYFATVDSAGKFGKSDLPYPLGDSSGGGSGTPGGSDMQIQFNDGGSFGGDSGLTYEKTSNRMTLDGDLSVNNCLTVRESWCNTVGYFNGDTIKTMNSAFYLDGPSNNTLMSCVGGDLSLIGNVVSGQKLYFSDNTSTNEVNYTTAAYAAGTKYTMTTTSAKVDFGTTDPAVTLPVAGTYMLYASANLSVTNGFSITRNTALPVSFKLYRTTSTAADISNTPISIYINNLSDSGCRIVLPPVEYTATAGSIAIELRGNMERSPAAGNIYIDDAEIVAVRTKR